MNYNKLKLKPFHTATNLLTSEASLLHLCIRHEGNGVQRRTLTPTLLCDYITVSPLVCGLMQYSYCVQKEIVQSRKQGQHDANVYC